MTGIVNHLLAIGFKPKKNVAEAADKLIRLCLDKLYLDKLYLDTLYLGKVLFTKERCYNLKRKQKTVL